MRVWTVTSFDAPAQVCDVRMTELGQGEVRIDVAACGLNFADLLMIKGTYQETPPLPFGLGMEVAGRVSAVGSDVTTPSVGDRVAAFVGHGGLAEQVQTSANRCVVLPDMLDDVTAAGLQIAYGTSHLALTRRARLRPGDTLVVLGAAGGVGLTAVEIGKAMGATVIAVARGADKLEVARNAGADHVLDATCDLRKALLDYGGADVLYDAVGGALAEAAIRAIKPEGRYLAIGFASGDIPQLKANHLLVKNIDVLGFYWGGYLRFHPEALTNSLSDLITMFTDGKITPHISHVIPFDAARDGLELIRSRKSTGKVVVTLP